MRTIHYVIFFDFFQEGNDFTERNSITIPDECTNTTREIMSYLHILQSPNIKTTSFPNFFFISFTNNDSERFSFTN